MRARDLDKLLKMKCLAVKEIDLFKAILRWVDQQFAINNIDLNEDKLARRTVLGDYVHEIRFLEMSNDDFARHVCPAGILTKGEIDDIFWALEGADMPNLKWKNLPKRRQPQVFHVSRFEVSDVIEGWDYNGESDALAFKMNKYVELLGVRLFGEGTGKQYKVSIFINDLKSEAKGTFTSEKDEKGIWGYDVMFPKPVCLQPEQLYVILATISGPSSCFGQYATESSCRFEDFVLTIQDAPFACSCNGTNKYRGQFHKFYFSSS